MSKVRGLAMPAGCEIVEFSDERRAVTLHREMIQKGYRPGGVHTNTLKPGKVSLLRHDGSWFVAWIKPAEKLDAHKHRIERRKDGSERELVARADGGFMFKRGGKLRRCVDCGEVA